MTLEEIEAKRAALRLQLTALSEEKKRVLYANRPGTRRVAKPPENTKSEPVSAELREKAEWLAVARPKLLTPGMTWGQIEALHAKETAKLRR